MNYSNSTNRSFWNDLRQPFFVLAPMEAVTDVVFRQVVKRAGAPDVFFTEFTNATGWVHAGDKAIRGRLLTTGDEHPIVAQIWGGEPGDMEALAKHCVTLGYDGIDINMGCPAKSAVRSGGSALITKPELAVAAIAAAKSAGLPVSVKTRLGYSFLSEWRPWLITLLEQDIAALTIHLRTKKEMSKVPAHHELIPEIKQLRDEIAPETLLIINGDIKDRAHGEELAAIYGVDGVMIGRGVFANPFVFAKKLEGERRPSESDTTSAIHLQPEFSLMRTQGKPGAKPWSGSMYPASMLGEKEKENIEHKEKLLNLLSYHLDLFDQYQPDTQRPFETLKRFFKIYIRDFDGASDLRTALMFTHSTDEVRELLANHQRSATF